MYVDVFFGIKCLILTETFGSLTSAAAVLSFALTEAQWLL